MSTETLDNKIITDSLSELSNFVNEIKASFNDLLVPLNEIRDILVEAFEPNPLKDFIETTGTIVGIISGIVAVASTLVGFPAVVTAAIVAAIAMLSAWIIENWNGICEFFSGIWTSISEGFSACWDAIVLFFKETLPATLETAVNFFAELPGKIWEFLSQAVGKLGEWASGLISKAGEVLPGVISSVVGFFSGLPGKMLEVGKNLVQGIWSGISNATEWVLEKIRGFGASIVNGIKNIFGIHSPSAIMRDEVGKNLALGVAEGITKNKNAVADAMSEMANVVANSDISVEPEVSAKSIDFEAFKEKLRPSLDFVKSQITRAQDVLNTQFAASLQLAGAMAGANNTYNNVKRKKILEKMLHRIFIKGLSRRLFAASLINP